MRGTEEDENDGESGESDGDGDNGDSADSSADSDSDDDGAGFSHFAVDMKIERAREKVRVVAAVSGCLVVRFL